MRVYFINEQIRWNPSEKKKGKGKIMEYPFSINKKQGKKLLPLLRNVSSSITVQSRFSCHFS